MNRYERRLKDIEILYKELFGFQAFANIFRRKHAELLWANLGAAIGEFKTLIKVVDHHENRIKELETRLHEAKRAKTQFLIFNGNPNDPKAIEYIAKRSSLKPDVLTLEPQERSKEG